MHFNADKFECLRFWPNPLLTPAYEYLVPDGQVIEVKETLEDLGVLSSNVTFQVQFETQTRHARGKSWKEY